MLVPNANPWTNEEQAGPLYERLPQEPNVTWWWRPTANGVTETEPGREYRIHYEILDMGPPPTRYAPTTGCQWCGVLHPDAPRECVVYWIGTWLYFNGNRVHVTDVTNGNISRLASPATPASIPHTRDDGHVEWRDDPELWRSPIHTLPYRRSAATAALAARISVRVLKGMPRVRLLDGTAASDPPSPWWTSARA